MRIVSWNVNGIRSVEKKTGFIQWLRSESPEVLCLQETRATPKQLAPEMINPIDKKERRYRSYWSCACKAGYSGVAVYTRLKPRSVQPLGIPEFDSEGRVLQADFRDFVVIAAYFPNSRDTGSRLDYKMRFCRAIKTRCDTLVACRRHVVLCGDYNIAHTPIDLARPQDNEQSAGYLPEERAWMDMFTRAGYVDTFRSLHPEEPNHYTWWSYSAHSRDRNVGWRLDYHCVDRAFMWRVEKSLIRADVKGSDHCPVELHIL
ncbi:MAG: exodeoxyribonuclease III [Spirochaetaceae bacterium]|jgi:exodeoxyribonuclease-3|nr:exodeoxyribonuclease III [Spirochaetaceae bacterium]